VLAYAGVAAAIALATPVVRATPLVDALPTWLQWYLRPAGEHTTFTLLPWAGFVFAGGATGALVAAISDPRAERRLHIALAAAGVALTAFGFWAASRPSLYAASSFWTSSPTWFAIRAGILMIALGVLFALSGRRDSIGHETTQTTWLLAVARSWQRPLARMGRASLFIYWIHVELVYGYATWAIHARLPLAAVVPASALFAAAMYGAVAARDRLALAGRGPMWRGRYSRPPLETAVE